ncbi:thioredoxin, partial [Candidatus Calescamantes bacterium]|nr:thioredoxin [Candidatus Calescamantes bacterium]MCK5398761.1 thioredoxin [bacterium]
MSEIVLNDNNFGEEIESHKGVALVDFWAVWCMPCKMVAPTVEQIAEEYAGRVKVGKVNVDENRAVAGKYGIMSIPTLLVFKDGEVVDQIVGAVPKSVIESKLKAHL